MQALPLIALLLGERLPRPPHASGADDMRPAMTGSTGASAAGRAALAAGGR